MLLPGEAGEIVDDEDDRDEKDDDNKIGGGLICFLFVTFNQVYSCGEISPSCFRKNDQVVNRKSQYFPDPETFREESKVSIPGHQQVM